jgi:mannosyl-oligosaccharide alpha-1,2-mannosidase
LLLGGLSDQYQQLYGHAIQTIKSNVLFKPMTETDEKILLPGNVRAYGPKAIHLEPQGQHLACFAGGMVALGSRIFDRTDDIGVARNLVDGCIWAYESMPTGIMPEMFHVVPCRGNRTRPCPWNQTKWGSEMVLRNSHDEQELDLSTPYEERIRTKAQRLRLPAGFSAIGDRRFLLRPEAIESIFVLYRITGDKKLQETAWKMFENIQKIARTEIAYAAIEDVTDRNTTKANQMESFWMAETLKYFYLLYSEPDVVDLDDFVLNTEAHPFKRPK